MMTIEEYKLLITSQYQNSTKFMSWLEANLGYLDVLFDSFYNNGTDVFDIDVAVGDQLDVLGVIIGRSRIVDFDLNYSFYLLQEGGDRILLEGSPSFLQLEDSIDSHTSILQDEDYRILLKAKIVRNNWKGRVQDLYDIFSILFPDIGIVIKDNQDMSMTIGLFGDMSDVTRELITRGYVVPKPMGVLINYFFGTLPVFGYDFYDSKVAGYNEGNWADYTLGG